MPPLWSYAAFIGVILIAMIYVVLWRWQRIQLKGQVIMSAILALLVFQLLFWSQRSLAIPSRDSLFQDKVLITLALILAFNTVLQAIQSMFFDVVLKDHDINLSHFVVDLFRWLVMLILLLVFVRQFFGVELTGLLLTSTIVTGLIALSLQEILGNFFAGIALQIDSAYKMDDIVKIANYEGKIIKQNWRAITILTGEENHIVLPNSQVTAQEIINYSRPTPLQEVSIFISHDYSHSPSVVKEILKNATIDVEGIVESPAPKVYVVGYSQTIDYRIDYWTRDHSLKSDIQDTVLTRCWYMLKRAEMELSLPLREIDMRMLSEDHGKKKEAEQQQKTHQVLRSLLLFKDLSDEQIQRLGRGAKQGTYTTGESLVCQGEEGDSLFIIKSGHVGVYIVGQDGGNLRVDERIAGEFFGEMSLLTGESRSASVVAEEETEVITIGKLAFTEILTADPTILELLLDALDQRRRNLEAKTAANIALTREEESKQRSDLLQKITQFLGISLW